MQIVEVLRKYCSFKRYHFGQLYDLHLQILQFLLRKWLCLPLLCTFHNYLHTSNRYGVLHQGRRKVKKFERASSKRPLAAYSTLSKVSHCFTELCQSNFINVSVANLDLPGVGLYKKKEFFKTRRFKNHFN